MTRPRSNGGAGTHACRPADNIAVDPGAWRQTLLTCLRRLPGSLRAGIRAMGYALAGGVAFIFAGQRGNVVSLLLAFAVAGAALRLMTGQPGGATESRAVGPLFIGGSAVDRHAAIATPRPLPAQAPMTVMLPRNADPEPDVSGLRPSGPLTVYLVGSDEEAALVRAAMYEADRIRVQFGEEPVKDLVLVVRTEDEERYAAMLIAHLDSARAGLAGQQVTVQDLRTR